MPLEYIVEDLVNKGRKEAEELEKEAEKQIFQIMKEAEKQVEAILDKAEDRTSKEAKTMREQELSSLESEVNHEELVKKKIELRELYEAALNRLSERSRQERETIVNGLIEKAKSSFDGGYIKVSNADSEFLKARLPQGYQIEGTIDSMGGFIVENKDKDQILDLTYEAILKEVWEEQLPELTKILFGKWK